jgi:hypothetical protein
LPVDLEIRGYPVAILTLKNRVSIPLVARFIAHIREFANSMPAPARLPPKSGPPIRDRQAGH